jgi:hypothetical protein
MNAIDEMSARDEITQTDLSREMPNFLLSHRDQKDEINEIEESEIAISQA